MSDHDQLASRVDSDSKGMPKYLKPAGYYTDRVIPAFFLGAPVDNIRSNLDGDAMVRLAGNGQWKAFETHATLFADAQRLGWTTGVVGWYNPYCRILAGTLNYCFWRMGDGQSDGAMPDHSALQNAVAPIVETGRGLKHEPGFAHERLEQDLTAIMPQAEALIRDQTIGFVFIHLPVPHPPGIYDRRLGRQRATGSLVDKCCNIAFARPKLPSAFSKSIGFTLCGITEEPTSPATSLCVK